MAQDALLGGDSEDILISPQHEGHYPQHEILGFFRHQWCAAKKKLLEMRGEGERWQAQGPQ